MIKVDSQIGLKEIELEDAQTVFNLVDANRQYLREWLPFVDKTFKVDDTISYIKSVNDKPEYLKNPVFVIIYEGQIVGNLGFNNTDRSNMKTEIGYWLAEQKQNKGIVTRAVKAAISYAFNEMNMNRICIKCAVENIKSCSIPQRLNFSVEGIERNGELLNDNFINLKIYSLLKSDIQK